MKMSLKLLHPSYVNEKTSVLFGLRRSLSLRFLHLGACPTKVCARRYGGTRDGVSDSVWEDRRRFREDFTVKETFEMNPEG